MLQFVQILYAHRSCVVMEAKRNVHHVHKCQRERNIRWESFFFLGRRPDNQHDFRFQIYQYRLLLITCRNGIPTYKKKKRKKTRKKVLLNELKIFARLGEIFSRFSDDYTINFASLIFHREINMNALLSFSIIMANTSKSACGNIGFIFRSGVKYRRGRLMPIKPI